MNLYGLLERCQGVETSNIGRALAFAIGYSGRSVIKGSEKMSNAACAGAGSALRKGSGNESGGPESIREIQNKGKRWFGLLHSVATSEPLPFPLQASLRLSIEWWFLRRSIMQLPWTNHVVIQILWLSCSKHLQHLNLSIHTVCSHTHFMRFKKTRRISQTKLG